MKKSYLKIVLFGLFSILFLKPIIAQNLEGQELLTEIKKFSENTSKYTSALDLFIQIKSDEVSLNFLQEQFENAQNLILCDADEEANKCDSLKDFFEQTIKKFDPYIFFSANLYLEGHEIIAFNYLDKIYQNYQKLFFGIYFAQAHFTDQKDLAEGQVQYLPNLFTYLSDLSDILHDAIPQSLVKRFPDDKEIEKLSEKYYCKIPESMMLK